MQKQLHFATFSLFLGAGENAFLRGESVTMSTFRIREREKEKSQKWRIDAFSGFLSSLSLSSRANICPSDLEESLELEREGRGKGGHT